MDEIDKLLAEIQAEYTKPKKSASPPNTGNNPKPVTNSAAKSDILIDNLLADVKADFQERDAAEELKKQQELEAEKKHQAKLKAQQRESLKKQAKEWLDKLDPLSSEGIWFEQFAQTYPSKLDAAIDYLQSS
jgi:hypothetical protein